MTPDTTLYHPAAALVVFTAKGAASPYIEYYDIDAAGCPVNPHPFSVREAQSLAKALDTREKAGKSFLRPEGIVPPYVLHIDPSQNGSLLWYTKPQRQNLFFTKNLNLPDGEITLPALVWKADRKHLRIYALKGKGKPTAKAALYHAPFFNLYSNGNVCMGSVSVQIPHSATLEGFIAAWHGYFFGSYFSHLIDSHNPVGGNLVSVYKGLLGQDKPFPVAALLKTKITLKDLL